MSMLPPKDRLTICFAHVAYQLRERFLTRNRDIASFQVRSTGELESRIGEADVLVVSGLWRNELLDWADQLRFIQSISAGVDQFDRELLQRRRIRLASARGANNRAVAEHAMALILALTRHVAQARDNQRRRVWRTMIGNLEEREEEIAGKTLLIIGLGEIGSRLAKLAAAFDVRVIGIRRNPEAGGNGAEAVHGPGDLDTLLPQADVIALTCPLTPQTDGLIGQHAFDLMRRSAFLINVSRGRCVDEAALIRSLSQRRIAGAGLDCFHDEPLLPTSPLWDLDNVLITPHTAGETRRYEDNLLDILEENLELLWADKRPLRNEIL
jgi:phosphoglycerate dehydrogenase-like enzyme